MKSSRNILFIVGLVLLIAGAAILVYGIITYNDVQKALGPSIVKAFTGSSNEEQQAIIYMVAGGAAALLGLILLFSPKFRRR
jgi:hypothetical protein